MSIPSLKKVYKATYEARSKWRNILLELEVEHTTIEALGAKWRDDPADCYRDGLGKWLEGGERTWSEMADALSSPTVGHIDIAQAIKSGNFDHLHPSNATSQQSTATVDPSHQVINEVLVIYGNEKIGQGAFGKVFKGCYRGTLCAVKVLHHVAMEIETNLPADEGMEESVKAFASECDFLRSFQHENVVQHYSTERHPRSGNAILVTELLDRNLKSFLVCPHEEALSVQCELSLSKDVASGLAYIHGKRIVHRDLCGDNILLTVDRPIPTAKVSDFGMSRFLDPYKLSSTLTAMGHRFGYLPPEAARYEGEKYDFSLDVFSLGAIMVQIVWKLETLKTAKDRENHAALIPETHVLKPHINECLQNEKERRPSAFKICGKLQKELEQPNVGVTSGHVQSVSVPKKESAATLIPEPSTLEYGDQQLQQPSVGASSHVQSVSLPQNESSAPLIPETPTSEYDYARDASRPAGETLEDFLKASNLSISSDQLNCEIETEDMPCIAAYFDDVELYLDTLPGLLTAERAEIRRVASASGIQVAMMGCLDMWKIHDPSRATYQALVDILLRLKKEEIALNVCKYLYTGGDQ